MRAQLGSEEAGRGTTRSLPRTTGSASVSVPPRGGGAAAGKLESPAHKAELEARGRPMTSPGGGMPRSGAEAHSSPPACPPAGVAFSYLLATTPGGRRAGARGLREGARQSAAARPSLEEAMPQPAGSPTFLSRRRGGCLVASEDVRGGGGWRAGSVSGRDVIGKGQPARRSRSSLGGSPAKKARAAAKRAFGGRGGGPHSAPHGLPGTPTTPDPSQVPHACARGVQAPLPSGCVRAVPEGHEEGLCRGRGDLQPGMECRRRPGNGLAGPHSADVGGGEQRGKVAETEHERVWRYLISSKGLRSKQLSRWAGASWPPACRGSSCSSSGTPHLARCPTLQGARPGPDCREPSPSWGATRAEAPVLETAAKAQKDQSWPGPGGGGGVREVWRSHRRGGPTLRGDVVSSSTERCLGQRLWGTSLKNWCPYFFFGGGAGDDSQCPAQEVSLLTSRPGSAVHGHALLQPIGQ